MSRPCSLPPAVVRRAVTAYRQGAGLDPLSEQLGVEWRTLRRALVHAGVRIRPKGKTVRPFTPAETAEAKRDYAAGASLYHLALRYHCSWARIRAVLAISGAAIRPVGAPGGLPKPVGMPQQALVDWEANTARAVARGQEREAARLAKLDRRCPCGGILRNGVRHQCAG